MYCQGGLQCRCLCLFCSRKKSVLDPDGPGGVKVPGGMYQSSSWRSECYAAVCPCPCPADGDRGGELCQEWGGHRVMGPE